MALTHDPCNLSMLLKSMLDIGIDSQAYVRAGTLCNTNNNIPASIISHL